MFRRSDPWVILVRSTCIKLAFPELDATFEIGHRTSLIYEVPEERATCHSFSTFFSCCFGAKLPCLEVRHVPYFTQLKRHIAPCFLITTTLRSKNIAAIDHDWTMTTLVKRTASETKQQGNGHSRHLSDAVHSFERKIEEQVDLAARNPAEERKGGYVLLVTCVGGIYASL